MIELNFQLVNDTRLLTFYVLTAIFDKLNKCVILRNNHAFYIYYVEFCKTLGFSQN